MIIDAHVHISLFEGNARTLEEAFHVLKNDMQKHSVEKAIIVPDNIENSEHIADLTKAIELVGDQKNFYFLGSPQIIQRGSGEVDRYQKLLEENRIVGLKFFPGHDPYFPTDDRCLPYYELCQRLHVPVLFHMGENSGDSACATWNDPKYIVEIAKKFPELKVFITHYYWPKIQYCYDITKNIQNIYFETAAMADWEVLEKSGGMEVVQKILKKTITDRPDQVIFGTDWPMCKIDDHIHLIKSLHISADVENKIFFENALTVYDL